MPKLFQHKHLGYKENFFTSSMNFIMIIFFKFHYIYNHKITKYHVFCQKLSDYLKAYIESKRLSPLNAGSSSNLNKEQTSELTGHLEKNTYDKVGQIC